MIPLTKWLSGIWASIVKIVWLNQPSTALDFRLHSSCQISSLLSEAFKAPSAMLSSRDIIAIMSHKLYIILEMPILKISISKQTSCWKSLRWTHHISNRILTSSGVQIFELWWHIAKIWSAWTGFYQETFLQKTVNLVRLYGLWKILKSFFSKGFFMCMSIVLSQNSTNFYTFQWYSIGHISYYKTRTKRDENTGFKYTTKHDEITVVCW